MNTNIEIWTFLAGLGLFLFAISLTEDSLKTLAGRHFKQLLTKHTDSHFKSILIGVFSTAILQSSSAVTLILLAFVGSGVIAFSNALGIIIGANLGTTITGWIVSILGFGFNIESYIFPIIAMGSLAVVFFKPRKIIYSTGSILLGFGLLFFGLSLMKESTSSFQSFFDPSYLSHGNIIVYALSGFILTSIIQSSSATMVIALTALNSQMISLDSAAALIIGADLGTTITVILGSINGSSAKKRVAAAHFVFNIVTDCLALLLLPLLLSLCLKITGSYKETYTLVLFHSLFNTIGIIVFLPFLKNFSNIIEKFIGNNEQRKVFSDIAPIHIDTATKALFSEAKKQVLRTIQLNLSLTQNTNKVIKSLTKNTFSKDYEEIKENEAIIINYALRVQEGVLDQNQSKRLKKILSGMRSCSMAAKSIKDIQHNMEEFRNSPNDYVFKARGHILNALNKNSLKISKTINENTPMTLFENLIQCLRLSENSYNDFLKEMNHIIRDEKIPITNISSLFNSNREVYNSNYFLILAVGDVWLNLQQSEDLMHIPQTR